MSTVLKFPLTRHPNLRHLLWRQVFAELHHLRTRSFALFNLLRGLPFLPPNIRANASWSKPRFTAERLRRVGVKPPRITHHRRALLRPMCRPARFKG